MDLGSDASRKCEAQFSNLSSHILLTALPKEIPLLDPIVHYLIIIIIIMRIRVASLLLLLLQHQQASADLVLTKKIMKLAATAAKLSSLAYEEDPPSEGFDSFGFYDE